MKEPSAAQLKGLNWAKEVAPALSKYSRSLGKILLVSENLDPTSDAKFGIFEGTYCIAKLATDIFVGITTEHLVKNPLHIANGRLLLIDAEETNVVMGIASGIIFQCNHNTTDNLAVDGVMDIIISYIKLLGIFCGCTEVSLKSLESRKKWLQENEQKVAGLLDAILGYQPHPSLDILLFNLPGNFVEQIIQEKLFPQAYRDDEMVGLMSTRTKAPSQNRHRQPKRKRIPIKRIWQHFNTLGVTLS
eukprot:TRINITY_DN2650_c0_g1_i1.p1 TRINITY_DN2650_c0_g1~~TRINITY_DN2650_c0_g1_i1.p1  ORF type:complete len:254 (+),score=11.74 TRINITY_DN2650_c0_g1_i1:27-764(+)